MNMAIGMFISKKTLSKIFIHIFRYMLLADYESYIKCQEKVAELFKVSVCFIHKNTFITFCFLRIQLLGQRNVF